MLQTTSYWCLGKKIHRVGCDVCAAKEGTSAWPGYVDVSDAQLVIMTQIAGTLWGQTVSDNAALLFPVR